MPLLNEKKFSFSSLSSQIDVDAFAVVSFEGYEAISKLYDFEIILVTDKNDIDISDVLENPGQFIIHRENNADVFFNGILAEFEEQREFNGYIFYRARLVPKTWWLTLTHHNQVCLDSSVSKIIEQTLKDGGLFSQVDFGFDLQQTYPKMSYVCQYDETHFDFVSRWAQREGIYYFFEQTQNGEKIIFTDTNIVHTGLRQGDKLQYFPVSGLDVSGANEVIHSFTCRQQMLPEKVFLKDYNYEKPSLEIEGKADVDPKGRGEKYIYGEHFSTSDEGDRLAGLRAEELVSKKRQFFGESSIPFINPGYTFKLEDHYRKQFNKRYLITRVTHKGHQKGYLTAGLSEAIAAEEEQMFYSNDFTAIRENIQFRPQLITGKPKIPGTIHAKVDGSTTSEVADIDSQGRYLIKLPFDLKSVPDGKASIRIRMMQAYASHPGTASQYGTHFPLHKGAEVLLSFINGNPDRPVIVGALANPETKSPVTVENQTQSVIRDNYGNELIFEAKQDEEEIVLRSPKNESKLVLGKDGAELSSESDRFEKIMGSICEFGAGTNTEIFLGLSLEAKLAMAYEFAFGQSFELFAGHKVEVGFGVEYEYKKMKDIKEVDADIKVEAKKDHILTAGDGICLAGGMEEDKNAIINAYDKGIVMSYGERTTNIAEDKLATTAKKFFWWTLVPGVITAILAKGFEIAEGGSDVEGLKIGQYGFNVGTVLMALIQTIAAVVVGIKSSDTEEPEFHEMAKMDSFISINESGIKLGGGPSVKSGPAPGITGDDAWKSNLEFAVNPVKMQMAAKIHVGENGVLKIRSKEKKILLAIGEAGSEEAVIELSKADENIKIEYGSSTIILKKDGVININSDENITINSKKTVELKGGSSLGNGFSFDGSTAKILGKTLTISDSMPVNTKYFSVTG